MYDWDQYYKRNSAPKDDPWDLTPEERRKKRAKARTAEAHSPTPDHVIGSCGPDVSYSSSQLRTRKKRSPGAGIARVLIPVIVVVSVLFSGLTSLVEEVMMDDEFEITEPGGTADTTPDSGDGFRWPEEGEGSGFGDIEPDAEDGIDIWEAETGPSEVELYTGDVNFSLQLHPTKTGTPMSYSQLYEAVLPSVVTITVYNDHSGAYGTGIVLSEDGYILTNQHVVACQKVALVTTYDNQTYEALLVGEDPNSDLALLKIEATGLTPAEFADSSELVIGQECAAIGNPLGITYRFTITDGIISGLDRTVSVDEYTMTLIQTTAPLNSGNSGGPLFNLYGQVIGINNLKMVDTEVTVEGMGFAIPSTTAKRVTDAIVQYGEVEHPVIGITCYAVTAGDAEGNEMDGVYVYTIVPGSDAAAQGLMVGDIITHINGQRIYQVGDVDLAGMRVGDEITVTIYREGETLEITFALCEQNDLTWDN